MTVPRSAESAIASRLLHLDLIHSQMASSGRLPLSKTQKIRSCLENLKVESHNPSNHFHWGSIFMPLWSIDIIQSIVLHSYLIDTRVRTTTNSDSPHWHQIGKAHQCKTNSNKYSQPNLPGRLLSVTQGFWTHWARIRNIGHSSALSNKAHAERLLSTFLKTLLTCKDETPAPLKPPSCFKFWAITFTRCFIDSLCSIREYSYSPTPFPSHSQNQAWTASQEICLG